MATLLIVILIGMMLTSAVVMASSYVHALQEHEMTTHAQMQSRMKAWTGVELVKQYLQQIQSTGKLTNLANVVQTTAGGYPLTFAGVTGVSAKITAVDNPSNPTQFTAQITGITAANSRAQSTATLQAVFSAVAGTNPGTGALNFNRNLKLGGSISIQGTTGKSYTINVLGDVSTLGNSITGVDTINATGSINLDSGSSYTNLNANCDVVISGSVTATNINTLRNICMTGSASATGTAVANGSIYSQASSSSNGTFHAGNNPNPVATCSASGSSSSGTAAATCPVPSYTVDLSAGNAGAKVVKTQGSVMLSSGQIGALEANRNLTVSSSGAVSTGSIGGTLNKPGWNNSVNVSVLSGFATTVSTAQAVAVATSSFNAFDYQSQANYAFTVDASGFMKVTVANINGVTNGTYYLGNYSGGGYYDYLCTTLTGSSTPGNPICAAPALSSSTKICKGYSDWNSCFSYNSSTGWSINGTSLAPGIAWFQGNLNLGNGTYFNTFIATGNIATSGSDVVYAPNYAGYSGSTAGTTYAPTGICANSYFPGLYPTQLCTTSTSTYNGAASNGLGNFALMAGSFTGTYTQGSYVGGNITLGASSEVNGNVKAGNEFQSGGSTTVAGAISALALGKVVQNSMGGSTTIRLINLPPTFTVTSSSGGSGNGGGGGASVSIKWARYL